MGGGRSPAGKDDVAWSGFAFQCRIVGHLDRVGEYRGVSGRFDAESVEQLS